MIGWNKKILVNLAINYGSKYEILNAAKKNDNRPIYKIIDLEKKIVGKKKYDIMMSFFFFGKRYSAEQHEAILTSVPLPRINTIIYYWEISIKLK